MKTLRCKIIIEKLDGFDENEFIGTLQNSLSHVQARIRKYDSLVNGYLFEIDYEPTLGFVGITYQPILSCVRSMEFEYGKIKLIAIPSEEMSLI